MLNIEKIMITLQPATIISLLLRELGLPSDTRPEFYTTSGDSVEIGKLVLCRTESVEPELDLFEVSQGGLNNPTNLRIFMIQPLETLSLSDSTLRKIKKLNILKVWQLIALYDFLPSKKISGKMISEIDSSLIKIPGFGVGFKCVFSEWFQKWISGKHAIKNSENYFTWIGLLKRDTNLSESLDNTILDVVPTIQKEK